MRPAARKAGLAALGALALLTGLIAAGEFARRQLADAGHYAADFVSVDCPIPAGVPRASFLAEAQYLAGLPDRLDRLDPRLPEQLAAGFGKHPWVKSVTSVRVRPPDPVIVQLTFRVPALVVGETVLDGDGVVLPRGASTQAIPRLTQPESPGRPAGQPHADPFAVASARVAALVQPHQGQLQLWAWERTDDGLILANESRRVLWGVPGNDDAAKLRRVVAGAGDVH